MNKRMRVLYKLHQLPESEIRKLYSAPASQENMPFREDTRPDIQYRVTPVVENRRRIRSQEQASRWAERFERRLEGYPEVRTRFVTNIVVLPDPPAERVEIPGWQAEQLQLV